MPRPQGAARSAFGGLSPLSGAQVFSEPGGEPEGRYGQVPGRGAPFPSRSGDDTPTHIPPLLRARRDAPRGSYNFPETSTGAWQTSASSCSARPASCALAGAGGAAEERAMGAFGPFPVRRRPRRPFFACAPAGTHTSAGQPSANSNAAVSGGAVGDAAVRGSSQAGEGRGASPARRQARVSRSGRRSLTLGGLTLDCGHREQQVVQASDFRALHFSWKLLGNTVSVPCLVPPPLGMKLAYRVD